MRRVGWGVRGTRCRMSQSCAHSCSSLLTSSRNPSLSGHGLLLPSLPPTTSQEAEGLHLPSLARGYLRQGPGLWARLGPSKCKRTRTRAAWDLLWVLCIRSGAAPTHYVLAAFPEATSSLLSFAVGASQADRWDWGVVKPLPQPGPEVLAPTPQLYLQQRQGPGLTLPPTLKCPAQGWAHRRSS